MFVFGCVLDNEPMMGNWNVPVLPCRLPCINIYMLCEVQVSSLGCATSVTLYSHTYTVAFSFILNLRLFNYTISVNRSAASNDWKEAFIVC
jgi:hypothetical protein